jgi:hypothetical protein
MIKRTYAKQLTAEVMTDIYTVPEGIRTEWCLMFITNPDSNNNKTIEIDYYNAASDTTFVILSGYTINATDFFQMGGGQNEFIIMSEGDKIKAKGQTGSSFSVLVSVIEHNNIVQGL